LTSLALSGAISGATTVDGATLSGGSLSATTVNGVTTANITTQGNTFNGNSQLVQTTAGGALPVLSGANLTNLSAAQVSGTLSSVTLASPTVTTTITGSGSPTLTGFGAITAGTFNGLTIGANALSVIGAGGLTITPGAGGITLANLAGVGIVHTDATGKLTTSALTNTDLSGTSVNIAAGTNLTGGNASLSPGGTATLNLNPTLTGITGITFTSGSLALNNGGIAAAGSIAGVTTISSNNTYTNTLASGTAINASGTPAANGTFVQLGNALSGGSASGTYIGTNQVGTADFFNFQKSGVSQLKLSSVGALTNAGGLTILSNGLSATGNSSITGTLSGLTGLAGSGTTAFSGPTSVTSTFTVNTGTGDQVSVNSGASAPTVDQVAIDNTGSSGVITNGVNSVNVHYKGGAAAVEGSGMRVDYTPGTTSGGTWSGVRIAEATPSAAGVNSYGVKLEGGGAGSGTSIAVEVASGWDIGVDVQSGGLQLAAQADPAAPTAGNLRIYAKDIAGKILPKFVGPSGVDTPFQASLGFNRIAFSEPTGTANCSTGAVGFGSTSTGAGTCVVPNISSANLLSSVRRETYSSGTTAGTVSYQRQSQLQVWRGNAPSLGGFFYTTRFGTSTTVAGNRAFVGLSSSIATPTNIDPTTSATIGRVGLVTNANTGDWSIATNAVGAAPSLINLGANFPIDNTSMYELVLFSAPNGTSIGYRVTNSSTGSVSSGTLSANLPTNTTFLAPQFWITNNATAAAATIDFAGWYLESDN
jgi:hypothetical protein